MVTPAASTRDAIDEAKENFEILMRFLLNYGTKRDWTTAIADGSVASSKSAELTRK